jgi:hypothetical protein
MMGGREFPPLLILLERTQQRVKLLQNQCPPSLVWERVGLETGYMLPGLKLVNNVLLVECPCVATVFLLQFNIYNGCEYLLV